jgi:hypothetical protein
MGINGGYNTALDSGNGKILAVAAGCPTAYRASGQKNAA